jgi:hypothetical protein
MMRCITYTIPGSRSRVNKHAHGAPNVSTLAPIARKEPRSGRREVIDNQREEREGGHRS